MHSKISGVSDFLAANELDAMMKARQVMANLNWHSSLDTQFVEPPWYDPGKQFLWVNYVRVLGI